VIAHVVVATWKPGVTQEQIRKVKSDFLALTSRIPRIEKVHWGESLATDEGEPGVAVLMLATDQEAIDAYHSLPEHLAFAEKVVSMTSSLNGRSYQL
jgi:hypothetical protein